MALAGTARRKSQPSGASGLCCYAAAGLSTVFLLFEIFGYYFEGAAKRPSHRVALCSR